MKGGKAKLTGRKHSDSAPSGTPSRIDWAMNLHSALGGLLQENLVLRQVVDALKKVKASSQEDEVAAIAELENAYQLWQAWTKAKKS